jgi:CRP-like cAMP-binding protein
VSLVSSPQNVRQGEKANMSSEHPQNANQLLSSLPPQEYESLSRHLEHVPLPPGKILFNMGDPIRYAYFPTGGQVSLLSLTEDGMTVEVAMGGNEGVIGVPVILRMSTAPYTAMVQIGDGGALRVRSDVLRQEFDRGGRLQDLLLRYTHVLLTQVSQSAICNRFHSLEERLSRWLLLANDIARQDTFHLTQEFIAHMLGTPRTGVTMAAGALQKAGLIRYSRGRIHVLNRKGLEKSSCECYQIVRKEFDSFLKH